MSTTPAGPPQDLLAHAFQRFEGAARELEQRQVQLEARAAALQAELDDAHRRLEVVLDALDSGIAVLAADGRVMRTTVRSAACACSMTRTSGSTRAWRT